MNRSLMLCAVLFTANLAIGCDQPDDAGTEYREQLAVAEITLEDALDALSDEPEAVVMDASFELGVDEGFYAIEAVVGDELVVYEVDARTGERGELERTPARGERLELARRHRHLRERLAQLVREVRAERPDERAVRARLVDDEAEIELMDRRGRRHAQRRRLAQ
jgi:hypothetical protein